jgi:hypothetical protein
MVIPQIFGAAGVWSKKGSMDKIWNSENQEEEGPQYFHFLCASAPLRESPSVLS